MPDRLCAELFLSSRARERDDNLIFVRERLLRSEVDPASLLDLYAKVRARKRVPVDDTNQLVTLLRLSGITRVAERFSPTPYTLHPTPSLVVRNRIYERVFDRRWVALHMPDAELRRQRAAYKRGLVRAAAVAGVIVAVTSGLALTAVNEARLAQRAVAQRDTALHRRELALVETRSERDRADRAAASARQAQQKERGQRLDADAARREAEWQGQQAVLQSQIAGTKQAEAESARKDATERLWQSYLAQARALRWSGRPGRRFDSLAALAKAAAIRPSLKLRNEAIACLALVDMRLATPKAPVRDPRSAAPAGHYWILFDAGLKRYAHTTPSGEIRLHRVADDRELVRLPGFGSPIVNMRFSPNGRFLAVMHNNEGSIHFVVWDLDRRSSVCRVPDGVWDGAMDFSPDSRWVAAGQRDGVIHLYELPSGREWKRFATGPAPSCLRFHPDGHQFAIGNEETGLVQIRDVDTGARLATLSTPKGVFDLAWRADGRLLAGAGLDWHIYLWNPAAPSRPTAVLAGHLAEVFRIDFNHRGDLLVSSSWDRTTRLWDAGTGRQLLIYPGQAAGFSEDDRRLGVRGLRPHGGICEVAGGRECRTIDHLGSGGVDISPDGRILASAGDDGIELWDLDSGNKIVLLPAKVCFAAAFDPLTGDLLSCGEDGLLRWPLSKGDASHAVTVGPPQTLSAGKGWKRMSCSQDGRTLALTDAESGIHVLQRGNPPREIHFPGQRFAESVAVSPDGRWVATGSWQGYGVRIWEARTGHLVRNLPASILSLVIFSPDGKWLVTATGEETRFWKAGTWQPGERLRRDDPDSRPLGAAFTRDGTVMAVSRSRTVIELMDNKTHRELARLESPNVLLAGPFRFSPDGSRLVTLCPPKLMQVWDLRAIRKQLAAIGLDWDQPPYPASASVPPRPHPPAFPRSMPPRR